MSERYEMVIGLEVHVQLNTKSKSFCGDENKFGFTPNSLVSPLSMGHPGTLPRLNQAQIGKSIRLGLAMNGKINPRSTYDRKNYSYPDLPKGYQITQDQFPIVVGGEMIIGDRTIRIHHIHMEEDAGKLIHDLDANYSYVDLNRAGVPLLEIVTEPDFRTAEEVEVFIENLRQLVRWLDVSDGNMEQGSLRCDVNLSLRRQGQEAYGNRCEIKNLNSMKFAKQAIAYERNRQTELLNKGEKIAQQTLNFDPVSGVTSPLRDKEEAHDYRYFPDPDLPPIVVSLEEIESIKNNLPELPLAKKTRWITSYNLAVQDANVLIQTRKRAEWVNELLENSKEPKSLSQFLVNTVIPYANDQRVEAYDLNIPSERFANFLDMIKSNKVAASLAFQKVFPVWIKTPAKDPLEVAKSLDLIQSNDQDELQVAVQKLIADNPKEAAAYRSGKKQLLGFFMGELMRAQGGKVNPQMAKTLISKALED